MKDEELLFKDAEPFTKEQLAQFEREDYDRKM
jgi:hypothetical protein